ncbi:translation elongation factor Ts [Blattabacterium cuenoti]|uniref:translation elongation factor Ts n=1 Tax=Blattabacterium cuenoti TaxID=1653831 RepID=UPI00163C64A5|nr:translation elongation factor Ts [Blattabacterium cuenoti]
MKISIHQINKLRKLTGIGIMDCKKALTLTKGNIDEAIYFLRKKGKEISITRSSFQMKDGAVISSVNADYTSGTIIGISCETDFLSKSHEFLNFLLELSKKSLNSFSKEGFLESFFSKKELVKDAIFRKMAIVKEKLELKIFERVDSPFVIDYTHNNHKISTLIGFSSKINKSPARNIAMHVTAMNPLSIDEDDIPNTIVEKEINFIKDQIKKEKIRSEDIKQKIVEGKIQKFIFNNTLLNQKFIRNNKINVKEYLNQFDNKIKINFFKRVKI